MAINRKITTGTISFRLIRTKINNDGSSPLQMRYSLNSKVSSYSLGVNLHPCNWDMKQAVPIYINKSDHQKLGLNFKFSLLPSIYEIRKINALMSEFQLDILNIEQNLIRENKILNNVAVMNVFKALRQKNQFPTKLNSTISQLESKIPSFVQYMREYVLKNQNRLLNSTSKVYNTIINMVENYEQTKNKQFSILEIDYNYLKDLVDYMVIELQLINATITRRLKLVKGFVSWVFRSNGASDFGQTCHLKDHTMI